MDHFSALQAFAAVAEEGGFAPAARKAGLATSSLTRQVDALEDHLGTLLLNRSTRSVTLTPAGEDYLGQAVRILADLEEANRNVSERDGPPRGILRISLPVVFARLHVTPILPDFLRACPEIEIEILMTDRMVNLVEDRIDVAIRLGMLDSSSLVARRLAPHHRRLCASPAYLAEHGRPQNPSDLTRHRCLTFSYGSADRTWRFARDGREESVRVRGPLRANDSETLKAAALKGLGLLLMPTWLVGKELADGTLCPVLPEWTAEVGRGAASVQSDAGIFALYLPDRKGSAKVRTFVDFLAARFGAPPYWDEGQ